MSITPGRYALEHILIIMITKIGKKSEMVIPAFGSLQIVFGDYDGRCDSTLKSFYRLSLFLGLM